MAAPLTPAVLHILMALADGELHGYAIMKRVEADSDAQVNMGPGTLYGSIKRMLDAGFIREVPAPPTSDDPRRVYYAITAEGSAALDAELDRYRSVVSLTSARQAHS